jgi:hypothetical protein
MNFFLNMQAELVFSSLAKKSNYFKFCSWTYVKSMHVLSGLSTSQMLYCVAKFSSKSSSIPPTNLGIPTRKPRYRRLVLENYPVDVSAQPTYFLKALHLKYAPIPNMNAFHNAMLHNICSKLTYLPGHVGNNSRAWGQTCPASHFMHRNATAVYIDSCHRLYVGACC